MAEEFGTSLDQIDALNSVNARPRPQSGTEDMGVMDPVAEADQRIGIRRAEELQERSLEAMQDELAAQQRDASTVTTTGRVNVERAPKFKNEGDYNEATSGERSGLVNYAKKFLGTPYVWGGTSALGMDCSGFVSVVMKRIGVNLPHSSQAMAQMGQHVGRDELRVGDLVFGDLSARNGRGYNGIDHVGVYIGNGQVIESSRVGNGGVQLGRLGSGIWKDYWARRYTNYTSGSNSVKYGNKAV